MRIKSRCLVRVNQCNFDTLVTQVTIHGHHPLLPGLSEIIILFTHIVQSFPFTQLNKKGVFQAAQQIFVEIIVSFTYS